MEIQPFLDANTVLMYLRRSPLESVGYYLHLVLIAQDWLFNLSSLPHFFLVQQYISLSYPELHLLHQENLVFDPQ